MEKKDDMKYQVELLERVKKELDMSQSDISRKLGIGTTSISDWTKEKRQMPTTARLALKLMLKVKEQEKELEIVDLFRNLLSKKEK